LELEKELSIKALIESWNFSGTHKAISNLKNIEGFSESEVNNMVDAYFENDQIQWICCDPDVYSFYSNLAENYKDVINKERLSELGLSLRKCREELGYA